MGVASWLGKEGGGGWSIGVVRICIVLLAGLLTEAARSHVQLRDRFIAALTRGHEGVFVHILPRERFCFRLFIYVLHLTDNKWCVAMQSHVARVTYVAAC